MINWISISLRLSERKALPWFQLEMELNFIKRIAAKNGFKASLIDTLIKEKRDKYVLNLTFPSLPKTTEKIVFLNLLLKIYWNIS